MAADDSLVDVRSIAIHLRPAAMQQACQPAPAQNIPPPVSTSAPTSTSTAYDTDMLVVPQTEPQYNTPMNNSTNAPRPVSIRTRRDIMNDDTGVLCNIDCFVIVCTCSICKIS